MPEGSITQTTKMYVRPVLTGDFKLPSGCHQVSGIYQIECSEMLDKDVTLKLGHYAVVDSQDEYADFSFYSAIASTGPPYVFEKIESESFIMTDTFASVKLRHFCFYNILCCRRSKLKYCSQVFYKTSSIVTIDMQFVVTKKEFACIQVGACKLSFSESLAYQC